MKRIILLLLTIFNLTLNYSQNLYPEKYKDCSLTSFCLDCGDTKAEPPKTLMNELLDKFDKKSLNKIKGNIEVQILIDEYGKPTYSQLINDLLTHTNFEVAIKSSYYAIQKDVDISKNIVDINKSAQISLKSAQKIGKSIVKSDLITKCLEYILDTELDNSINWKKVITDPKYLKSCGNQIFQCKAYVQTDATALVNSLDVFNDVLVHYLFEHTPTFNQCEIGKIGSVLHAPTGKFASTYPKFYKLCKSVHELRLESDLSHPKVKGTTKTTRRLRFKEIKQLKKTLIEGYKEYIAAMKHL